MNVGLFIGANNSNRALSVYFAYPLYLTVRENGNAPRLFPDSFISQFVVLNLLNLIQTLP